MFNFIARNFSSLASMIAAPFAAIWRLIVRLFPERDFTIMTTKTGDVYSYHQSSFWRFARGSAKVGLIIWAAWASYVFSYHRPMLQSRTAQLEEERAQHARQLSDLSEYHKRFTELTREINVIDDKIAAEQTAKKPDQKNIDSLSKQRLNIWAQLDLLQTRLNQIWTDGNYSAEFVKLSDLSMEYELVRAENVRLQNLNREITEAAAAIYDADSQITERVSKLAESEVEALSKHMKKISGTLTSLGLTTTKLVSSANKLDNQFVGSAITPISLDANMDPKYQKLADQVEMWQGLSRLKIVLPFGAPVKNPRITSNYGTREDPIDGGQKQHKGIDFGGSVGTPLLAVAPGKVISAGERSGYGRTVEIDHGLGFSTLYAHLSRINVRRGDTVQAGDVIGLGGSSGRSTGPHLHYEIRYNDAPFNPSSFVKE